MMHASFANSSFLFGVAKSIITISSSVFLYFNVHAWLELLFKFLLFFSSNSWHLCMLRDFQALRLFAGGSGLQMSSELSNSFTQVQLIVWTSQLHSAIFSWVQAPRAQLHFQNLAILCCSTWLVILWLQSYVHSPTPTFLFNAITLIGLVFGFHLWFLIISISSLQHSPHPAFLLSHKLSCALPILEGSHRWWNGICQAHSLHFSYSIFFPVINY